MKKLIALIAVFALCAALLVPAMADENPDLIDAKNYIYMMYKNKPETTPVDYIVVGVANIGGVEYVIDWTADSDTVKFIRGEDKMVTVDVDEDNAAEVVYALTATIKDDAGNAVSVSFNHKVPAAIKLDGKTEGEIAAFLHAFLADDGQAMPMAIALAGVVSEIPTAYSEEYKNITVNIVADGDADNWIQCYRLTGDAAATLQVGDTIGVMGIVKNYKGTIEFDKGCKLVPAECVASLRTVLDAYTLDDGAAKNEAKTVTGVVTEIPTPYSEEYKNITVNMVVGGQADNWIQCYRLTGEGADTLTVGDTITVTGIIKNYKGTIEFDKGCTLDTVVKAE